MCLEKLKTKICLLMQSENVPPQPLQNEAEKLEKQLLKAKEKKRSEEKITEAVGKMMDELKSSIKEEIKVAAEDLWAKTEPLLKEQKRVTAAMVESLDEFMAGKNGIEEEESASPPPASDQRSEDTVEKSPSMEDGEPAQALPPQNPGEGPKGQINQAPLGKRGRGYAMGGHGPRGQWKSGGQKTQKRVGYLVRQLEREFHGHHDVPPSCSAWNCRGGRGWDRRGRGGGRGRGGRGMQFARAHYHAGPSHGGR